MPKSPVSVDQWTPAVQFSTAEQQKDTASLGMWTFLATEVLFFGGLFLAYTVYRASYPDAVTRAGRELNITIGTINTAILLTSSFFMAMAVHAAELGHKARTAWNLVITWLLGLAFAGLKAYEYYDDIEKGLVPTSGIFHGQIPPGANLSVMRLFYFIYYAMTALHATHLLIGLGILSVILARTLRGEFSREYHSPVEIAGLYWHFVDLVWIFLYPLLYLMGRSL